MVTISHIVKKIVSEQPFVEEALGNNIISVTNLAEQLIPKIEKELGKKVKQAAIVMALRRYSEQISEHRRKMKKFDFGGEILLKTNVCDFTIIKTPSLLAKLKTIYNIVDFGRGDLLNVILGNNEVSIIINEKHMQKLTKFLSGEKILNKEKELVALTIIFTADDFVHTPGVIFNAVRKLAWENINIYEVVSTMTELTFILSNKDSMKAYNVLQEMVSK
jgi:aspartokinase